MELLTAALEQPLLFATVLVLCQWVCFPGQAGNGGSPGTVWSSSVALFVPRMPAGFPGQCSNGPGWWWPWLSLGLIPWAADRLREREATHPSDWKVMGRGVQGSSEEIAQGKLPIRVVLCVHYPVCQVMSVSSKCQHTQTTIWHEMACTSCHYCYCYWISKCYQIHVLSVEDMSKWLSLQWPTILLRPSPI